MEGREDGAGHDELSAAYLQPCQNLGPAELAAGEVSGWVGVGYDVEGWGQGDGMTAALQSCKTVPC